MAKCINIKHKDFIKLLEDSKLPSLVLEVKIAKWQEENNSDEFPSLSELSSDNQVNYQFKSVNKILQNFDKVKQWYKQVQNPPVFWEKLQKDLGIPKEQVELLKQSYNNVLNKGREFDKNNPPNLIEEALLDFIANYSYTVEINTAKESYLGNEWQIKQVDEGYDAVNKYTKERKFFIELDDAYTFIGDNKILNAPTQHYSNLTVPGGINYTENAHIIPELKGKVLPDIYAHHDQEFAQGNLDMYGWDRSDEQINKGKNKQITGEYADEYYESLYERAIDEVGYSGTLEEFRKSHDTIGATNTKTRRILEIQSKFQKWRLNFEHKNNKYQILENQPTDKPNVFEDHYLENGKRITSKEYNKIFKEFLDTPTSKEDAFIKLIAKQWETMMIKSIIQDTAKQTVTEVQESDVEAKVKELEKEGLLEIDCKGKLKAEKGLQTNFTKGGKWKIYEIFEGKSHKQGGIDINIKNNQISFTNKNGSIKAKYGLVISKENKL